MSLSPELFFLSFFLAEIITHAIYTNALYHHGFCVLIRIRWSLFSLTQRIQHHLCKEFKSLTLQTKRHFSIWFVYASSLHVRVSTSERLSISVMFFLLAVMLLTQCHRTSLTVGCSTSCFPLFTAFSTL